MDQIPIKYLVTQAQGLQQELGGEMWYKVFTNRIILVIILYKDLLNAAIANTVNL